MAMRQQQLLMMMMMVVQMSTQLMSSHWRRQWSCDRQVTALPSEV